MVSLTVGAQISNILGFRMVKCVPIKYRQSGVPLRDSLSKRIANLCNLSRIEGEAKKIIVQEGKSIRPQSQYQKAFGQISNNIWPLLSLLSSF